MRSLKTLHYYANKDRIDEERRIAGVKYDKKHYNKYSKVVRGLVTLCHINPKKYRLYAAKYNGEFIKKDWVIFMCANLYLAASKKKAIPAVVKRFFLSK